MYEIDLVILLLIYGSKQSRGKFEIINHMIDGRGVLDLDARLPLLCPPYCDSSLTYSRLKRKG